MKAKIDVDALSVERYVREGLERDGLNPVSVSLRHQTTQADRPWESDQTTIWAEAWVEVAPVRS